MSVDVEVVDNTLHSCDLTTTDPKIDNNFVETSSASRKLVKIFCHRPSAPDLCYWFCFVKFMVAAFFKLKVCSCEIRKVLNVEPLSPIGRS